MAADRGGAVQAGHGLASRVIQAFQASAFARPEGASIGVEEELRETIIPGCPDLLARVDLLIDTPSELTLTELKTSRTRWNREQAEDAAEQLLLYIKFVRLFMPDKPVPT